MERHAGAVAPAQSLVDTRVSRGGHGRARRNTRAHVRRSRLQDGQPRAVEPPADRPDPGRTGRPVCSGARARGHTRVRTGAMEPPDRDSEAVAATTRGDVDGELRLRRGDHRLGVRRERRRTACRGEGLPGRRRWSPASGGRTRTSRRASGICRASCGFPRRSCTGSRESSTSTTCSSSPARASAAGRTSTPTRCTSRRSSSSTRRSGRASPTGPTSWRRTSTRQRGCSASCATRTCRPTSIASCSRSRPRWEEARRSTRPRWASTSGAPASRPTIRTSAASGRAAPVASRAASATSAAATTPRTS